MMRLRLLACALLVSCLGAGGCKVEFTRVDGPPPIRGEASFGEVKLATEIDAVSKAPVHEVSAFAPDTPALHVTVNVKNVRAGAEFRFVFTKGGEDAGAIVMSVPADLRDNWVAGSLFPSGGLPVGNDWSVDVLYNGESIGSKIFTVEAPGGTPMS
jgi:hypothetical protein